MLLCAACHGNACQVRHMIHSVRRCDACRRASDVVDCLAAVPLAAAGIAASPRERPRFKRLQFAMYRNTARIEYPARRLT